jgi:hypothetical protein
MFRRTSARIVPGGDDVAGDNPSLLFSTTAPARLPAVDPEKAAAAATSPEKDYRSGGDIYADILATESRFGMGDESLGGASTAALAASGFGDSTSGASGGSVTGRGGGGGGARGTETGNVSGGNGNSTNNSAQLATEASSLAAAATREWDEMVAMEGLNFGGRASGDNEVASAAASGGAHTVSPTSYAPPPNEWASGSNSNLGGGSNSSSSSSSSSASSASKAEEKVKGVSLGVMHVPGLLDALKTKSKGSGSGTSGGSGSGDVCLTFVTSPSVAVADAQRLASELSLGL